MNQRDRIEQRRIVMKAIRSEQRSYAAALRKAAAERPGSIAWDAAQREANHAHSASLGMRTLADSLGIVDYFGPLHARNKRIGAAKVTRRPFRLTDALTSLVSAGNHAVPTT